jgi:dihydroorotate dehydrogenase
LNIQASPIGQAVFERLLKACGEVEWKDDTTSILVLKQIQVDAPYEPINCTIVQNTSNSVANKKSTAVPPQSRSSNSNGGTGGSSGMTLEDVSLDRVKKIVASSIGIANAGTVDNNDDANATITATATSS